MSARKNPGLGARTQAISAAVAASDEAGEDGKLVGVGIRMPKSLHDELRRISYQQRVSLNTLLVEGAKLAVAERDRKAGN